MIQIIYVCDTGRKIYIEDKKVYDSWEPPTLDEVLKIFKRNGISDNTEVNLCSLHECIKSCSKYKGNLEIDISYECKLCKGGCELI